MGRGKKLSNKSLTFLHLDVYIGINIKLALLGCIIFVSYLN
jgi:hypothetical protein